MSLADLRKFLHSRTARLTASYLIIIMVLSLSFSLVLYKTSSNELSRQIPPESIFTPTPDELNQGFDYHYFFQRRIDEARDRLIEHLVILNLLVLAGGALLSYYLAERTLEPIEAAMAAQSRFVTDASHELRTPLTTILTSNEVALRKPHLSLTQAKQLIKSSSEEMSQLKLLTDNLLSLSQRDVKTQLEPLSLQDVASDAMNQVLPVAQLKHIGIEDSVPPIQVMGEAAGLTQAVSILLDNAIKYSSDKSTIYISGQKQDGYGQLSVRDKGIGIPTEDLPHIFERFYRADPARHSSTGGHGIGLSIAQKIIEQHNGHISVTSTPGKGSTFNLFVSLAKPKS